MNEAKMTIISGNSEVTTTPEQLKKANDFLQADAVVQTKKQYMGSPELEAVAKKVIKDKKLELGPAEVWYCLVYPNISKKRPAKVKKASDELKHHTGIDYMVQISGELWDMLDSQTKEILVFNQLLHIDPCFKTKTQEWKMKLRKPNYTDYYEISESEGNEWHRTVQATMSSLYDMDPKQEDQISLF